MNYPKPDPEKKALYDAELKRLDDEAKKILEAEGYSQAWHKALAAYRVAYNRCANCGSTETVLRNYSMMWHDGDVCCARCDCFIRYYDAG